MTVSSRISVPNHRAIAAMEPSKAACTILHYMSGYAKKRRMIISAGFGITKWRTKLLTSRNGHGQSGWPPIGCEGLYFHAMCKNM